MAITFLFTKAASTVLTGAVGVAAYNAARKAIDGDQIRDAAVTATEWGMRGVRKLEEGAEAAISIASDVVTEAKGRIGEAAAPQAEPISDGEH